MLRWLILGAGGWGTNYVRATRALRGVRVVGYADVNAGVLKRLRGDGVAEALLFDDAKAALKATKPDVVSCSVPNPQRVPILLAAIKSAEAVIIDKPLAHTAADVRKIVAATATSGARVCVAQDYRYKPGARKVRALLDEGRLGRISNVTVQFARDGRGLGSVFYGRLEGAKVIGLELGIHHLDLMRSLLGREAVAVDARSWRPAWSWGRGDTALQALVGFGDVHATYSSDLGASADHTSWSGRWTICGERSDLRWDDGEGGATSIRLVQAGRRGPVERQLTSRSKADSMQVIIRAFADAVKSGGPMPVPLDDNVRSMGLALAAVESCRRRKEIEVARFLEKEGLTCR